jgi:hypothetical protein
MQIGLFLFMLLEAIHINAIVKRLPYIGYLQNLTLFISLFKISYELSQSNIS